MKYLLLRTSCKCRANKLNKHHNNWQTKENWVQQNLKYDCVNCVSVKMSDVLNALWDYGTAALYLCHNDFVLNYFKWTCSGLYSCKMFASAFWIDAKYKHFILNSTEPNLNVADVI